jgi:aldose 1-epimerase
MIEKTLYGKLANDCKVFLYTLKNKYGTEVKITNFGAIVTNLFVADKNGILTDVVLGYDSLNQYEQDQSFFGAIVGRYANRINKGKFRLNGKEYQLPINNGKHHLHGGPKGFYKVLWQAESIANESIGDSLSLSYISDDGEQGYPGTVKLNVIYSLTDENELKISYEGITDKLTILNLTHHSYFNLNGDFNKTILSHELAINADQYTPVDNGQIPTGELATVEHTPMDFRVSRQIGLQINDDFKQLEYGNGYDHNWVLNNYNRKVRKVASVYEPESGRFMEILTDQPGLQFYSGNSINGSIKGKEGIEYKFRTGLCLETQHFPDSPNKPEFPSVTLKPGETYKQTTIYKFSIK